jgi:hypothetical protein
MTCLETRTPGAATPGDLLELDLSEWFEDKHTVPARASQGDLAGARARVRAWQDLTRFCERQLETAYDDLVSLEAVAQ